MATLPPDFEDSNWPDTTSRLDRRDPINGSLIDRIRAWKEERRRVTEEILKDIHQLSHGDWGFINTAPAKLEPDSEQELELNRKYNSQEFTKSIDRKKLKRHINEQYWSYIQIINRKESANSEIKNQILVFKRNSTVKTVDLIKLINLKTGEAFSWDGKFTPEWEIILRKEHIDINNKIRWYRYHWEIYLRDPENPIKY